jgi:RNA polymerase sigma-70 factor (ECF subfamily)
MGITQDLQIGLTGPALARNLDDRHRQSSEEGPVAVMVVDEPPPFEEFFLEHRDRIGRALSLTVGDSDLGFEAVDEAMARAYSSWDTIGHYANPEGWVYRTGLNWATSWLRKVKRGRAKAPLLAQQARQAELVSSHADVDLAEAVMSLNENHRSVVVLRFFCDMSVEEAADTLGIAPGTVKSRLSRALETLGQHRRLAARTSAGAEGRQ